MATLAPQFGMSLTLQRNARDGVREQPAGKIQMFCSHAGDPETPFAEAGHHTVRNAERDVLDNNKSCKRSL